MKEVRLNSEGLTSQAQEGYPKGGDIFMVEPENGEDSSQKPNAFRPTGEGSTVDAATRRLEEQTARQGEQRRAEQGRQASAAGSGGRGGEGNRGGNRDIPSAPPISEEPTPGRAGNGEQGSPFTDATVIRIENEIGRMDSQSPIYSEFLKNQIRRIQELKDTDKVNPEEAWRLEQRLYLRLGMMMQSQMREDSSQNLALKDISAINKKNLPEEEKEKEAIEVLRDISTSEGLRTELIDSIMEYDNALEYLINRIISEPLDAETSGYQLSFYGGINFALIRDRMRVWSERERREAFRQEKTSDKYAESIGNAERKEGLSLKFEYMKSGAELFHNMNWKIVTGDIEQFVGVARGITVEHLQVLQRVNLAAAVMRLYEQELQNVISRDGKITPENYAEVTGTILDKKGNPTGRIPGRVEKLLTLYNDSLPLAERLESWQLKWAFYSGRNMMNITLRAAEVIAQSKEIGYRSYVQESASRIVDPVNLTGERFGIAEPRGGIHFLSMVKKIFDRNKRQFGWMENGIKTMMGGDRVEFESRGIFNITGVWSSWRENNIVQIWETNPDKMWETDPNDPEKKSRRSISIEEFMGRTKKEDPRTKEVRVNADALKGTFLDEKRELKQEICHSLGILLRTSELLPAESYFKDGWDIDAAKAKREIRTAIWKRTAIDNPLAMINFMRGMRFEEGKEPQVKEGEPSINTRLAALDKLMFAEEAKFTDKKRWAGEEKKEKKVLEGKYEETKGWKELREKLAVAHETRMRKLSGGELVSLDDVINGDLSQLFFEDEKNNIKELRELGQIVAPSLADVRFPSNPFMNDVLLEDALYTKAGAEFFRRRLGGDIVQFHGAGGNLPKLMDNPGGIPHEEALKIIAEMERSLEGPNGAVSGQDDVSPVLEAYLEFTEAGGNAENVPGFVKFLVQESVLGINIGKMLKKRNSWAQVYAGPGVLAEDIFQTSKTLDEALKMGILRRGTGRTGELWTDLYERFRKKFKAKPMWFILRFIFDAFPIFAAGMFFDIGQKSVKEKG